MEALAVDAFNYLLEIQSKANPASIDGSSNTVSTLEFVHFRLNDYHLLIPIHMSSEVLLHCRYSRVPDSEPWLFGITNNRGKLITLIDLDCFLLKAAKTQDLRGKRVVVIEYGNSLYGFIVDQVYGVMQSTALQASDEKNSLDDALMNLVVEKEFISGSDRLCLLNLPVFFQQILGSSL